MRAMVLLTGCRESQKGPREVWGAVRGPEEAGYDLMGTPCSPASLDGHTYLHNGKGPGSRLHYWTHLSIAPDKVTASLHGKRTLWLVVKENKSHRGEMRRHLLDGSDKYERSCTTIIKRWEEARMYYQYLVRYYFMSTCEEYAHFVWWWDYRLGDTPSQV